MATAVPAGELSHPTWFRRAVVPTTIVCGPPGSGKSTFVRERANPGDLVICYDQLAEEMFGTIPGLRTRTVLIPRQAEAVLARRNDLIAQLFEADATERWRKAWIIVSEPRAQWRSWWAQTLGAKVVVLLTDAETCRNRIDADARRGDKRGREARTYVAKWFRQYSPAACDIRG